MVLIIEHLQVGYGGTLAVQGVSLYVERGEILAVIGANGSGKTTLLRAIAGLMPVAGGQIVFEGEPIERRPTRDRVERGLALVPQGRALFAQMTVFENLMAGGYLCRTLRDRTDGVEAVFALFPMLRERREQPAGTLSGGEQQMLAIGRALVHRPRLLLLDEPSFGLAPSIIKIVARIIEELSATGTSVLLVEQNVRMALGVARRACLLREGRWVAQGPAGQLLVDDQIRDAYLGQTSERPPSIAPEET